MNQPIRFFQSLNAKITLFTLVVFLLSLWSLALYIGRSLSHDITQLLGEQQFSTASVMAKELDHEVLARFAALEDVAERLTPTLLSAPGQVETKMAARRTFLSLFNGGAFVVGLDGVALASLPFGVKRVGLSYLDRDYIRKALNEGEQAIGRPVLGKGLKTPVFVMAVPMRDEQNRVVGALCGVVDLSQPSFLDGVANTQYGQTGGFFLVNPAYRQIVTGIDKTRIMEVLPAPGVNPWIDRFIDGYEGSTINLNAKGVEVLTSIKRVPSANWFLAVFLPTNEAFAPIVKMRERILITAIFLSLLAGGLTWWMLSYQLLPLKQAALQLAAQATSSPGLQPFPVTRPDEIGQLLTGFNQLLAMHAQHQNELNQNSARLRILTDMSSDFIWESDAEHRLTMRTESRREKEDQVFSQYSPIGYRRWEVASVLPDEAGWQAHRALLDAHLPFRDFEIARPRNGGQQLHHISISGDPLFDAQGQFTGYLGLGKDITERKRYEAQIENLAYFDPLTGLPNRRLLLDRLKLAQAHHSRYQLQGALLFIDLDNFKTLNDTLGHDMGDLLLKAVAQALTSCVRESDTVARLGGDEFVVMLGDLSDSAMEASVQARGVGEKIISALSRSFQLGNYERQTSPSIGITLFGQVAESTDEPLKRADLAMYQAKAAGRNTLRFYDPHMQSVVNAGVALQASLIEALAQHQFELFYQPQINAQGHLVGVEALIRWHHPERGMVAPAEFVAMAEETGLIVKMGHWVLQTACEQLVAWSRMPARAALFLAVNVSPRQFQQPDFVRQVQILIEQTGAPAHRLKLELTEGMLLANMDDVIEKMSALKALGVRFSLDDFGTGYSSLAHLKNLPLSELKIDQGFVRDILVDKNDEAIAKMVIVLAGNLGLGVIAEGVETEAQKACLAHMGCLAYQGYLISRPLPTLAFEQFASTYGPST